MHAQLLLDTGDASTARRHIHRLLSREPRNAGHWLMLAHALHQCQRSKSASMAVRRALRLCPDHADPWSLASWLALEDKRLTDARAAREHVIRLAPDAASTHIQEAITLAVFLPFALFSMGEPVKLDYLWAALCMVGAVYFIFRSA